MVENYDRLGGIARAAGLKGRYTESHENGHVFVGDGMDLKRKADIPMSADRKSTRLNSSHTDSSRMPSSA